MKDAHTEHCCKNCGCKYGEDVCVDSMYNYEPFMGCSVVSGRLTQTYPCGKANTCGLWEEYDNANSKDK